jgi:D-alanyl-lipoteichoic acid acyltransferase DltB (MBOAT superfamily)
VLFNSYVFIFAFLPITVLGYFGIACAASHRHAKMFLAIASLVFYGWWNASFLVLILGSILFNFALGTRLAWRESRTSAQPWLGLGIAANLAVLAYYKYAAFVVANVQALTGLDFAIDAVVLPLAISFFTFQQIAYLIDASRREVEDHRLVDYVLFVTFFPQLIAGPIVHHREMMRQFQGETARFDHAQFACGIAFFVIGLAKKVLIADSLSALADPVFAGAHASPPGLWDAWQGVLAFSLGIYFDFSGYSDMAVGLARMFGIRLPYNFNSPYQATSIVEFWRRWHMTLSRFLRDYLYVPLGGNRRGPARRYANLMITMLLGGLWHGAGWTFVIWGALHGFYLLINHAWAVQVARLAAAGRVLRIGRAPAQVLTLSAVVFAWVFFRADSFAHAMTILGGMAGLNGAAVPASLQDVIEALGVGDTAFLASSIGIGALLDAAAAPLLLTAGSLIVLVLPNSQAIVDAGRAMIADGRWQRVWAVLRFRPSVAWAGALALVFLMALTQMSEVKAFVYFQF